MIRAILFSPGSSKAKPVTLSLEQGALILEGEESARYSLKDCQVHQPVGNNPQVVELPDGSRLEIMDRVEFLEQCRAAGHRTSMFAYSLENRGRYLLFFLLFFFVFGYLLFTQILPRASQYAAHLVPAAWANKIDSLSLGQLDEYYLSPSELGEDKKEDLRQFLLAHSDRQPNILFRRFPGNMANAFALAGNTLVITDALVEGMNDQRHLVAVYMHELGHLEHRHSLEGLIRSSSLGVLSMLVFGDMPGVSESVVGLGLTLADLSFSRDDESQADDYALEALQLRNISPHCLADAFRRLGELQPEAEANSRILKYLSTHPLTEERIKRIETRFGDQPGCVAAAE